jgi:transposase InsO family protein
VLSHNGSCYRSNPWRETCAELNIAAPHVRLKTTRPLGMVFISYFGEWA